jgi:hypothetical protein
LQTLQLSHTLQNETYVPTKNHACIPLLSLEGTGRKKRGSHMLSQRTTIEPDKKYTKKTSHKPPNIQMHPTTPDTPQKRDTVRKKWAANNTGLGPKRYTYIQIEGAVEEKIFFGMQEKLLLSSSIAQRCLHRLSPAALLLSPCPSLRCLLVCLCPHTSSAPKTYARAHASTVPRKNPKKTGMKWRRRRQAIHQQTDEIEALFITRRSDYVPWIVRSSMRLLFLILSSTRVPTSYI